MAKQKPDSKAKRSAKAPPGPGPIGRAVRWVVRAIWGATWRVTAILLIMLGTVTAVYYAQLPDSKELFDGRGTGSVILDDREGRVFAWRGEQYGGELRAGDVSPHLVNAVIAVEDKRYYQHVGIDPRGIARAMYQNYKAGRLVQGGSTLTQQVAKNVFLDASRSLERKLKELPMALALELKYTKEEILSVYLNRVYLGAGTHGFEAASQRYFGKSARLLSAAEAAMLAGLLRAPSRYAPTNDLSRAQGRASVIVRLMEEQGYLTQRETIEALANPAVLSSAAAARAGGAFADWIMEDGGQDQFLDLLKAADIEIETTFDPEMQRMAEAALADVFDRKVKEGSEAQAAIVVMDYDGAVRAMVGGRERGAARFNRATQALRQTGSAFKPIVYAAGLEKGLGPLDIFQDVPITIGNWSPKNYGGNYRGPMTLREALARSVNTIAVRVSEQAGRGRVRDLAGEMGISTELAPGPAIALGTSEAKLIDMVGVFATVANGGQLAEPHGVRAIRLRGDDTPIDQRTKGPGDRVISEKTAGLLTHMMQAVVTEGTGKRAQVGGWQVAGKTGTTQKARDAWFIGYTADFVAGVWMGYDDNRPLTGVTGGGLPAEIWSEVMRRIHDGRTPRPLKSTRPPEPQVVLAPAPSRPTQRDTVRDDSVIETIFRDVLRGLGGAGESQRNTDFKPNTAEDR
ncbi:MAG: PBP1A family penicillin-binding protein [Pseudomonadota bacterium]